MHFFHTLKLKSFWIASIMFSILINMEAIAQISRLPHTETFNQSDWEKGEDVEFIDSWIGNLVRTDSRIFQTDNKELAIIPTSSFEGIVSVQLNLENHENVAVTWNAKSVKNGTGDRKSSLFVETSLDGGLTWHTRQLIQTFENENSNFSTYKYVLSGGSSFQKNTQVRFIVQAEEGEGDAAQVVLDDVTFFEESEDVTPPEVIEATVILPNRVRVRFNEPMDLGSVKNQANYQGVPAISSISESLDKMQVNLQLVDSLQAGKDYFLSISGVKDVAGNVMSGTHVEKVVFNDSRPNIFISEIMYNSPAVPDSLEFLEIYNTGPGIAKLGGLYFSSGLDFTFPEHDLGVGEYIVIAANAQAAKNFYGVDFLEWEEGALNNSGEKLEIKNSINQLVTTIKYKRNWGGDGDGKSISYCNPTTQNMNSESFNWSSTQTPIGKSIGGFPIYASPMVGCGQVEPEIRFSKYSAFTMDDVASVKVVLECVNPNAQPTSATINLNPQSTAVLGQDFIIEGGSLPLTKTFAPGVHKIEFRVEVLANSERKDIRTAVLDIASISNGVVGARGFFEVSMLNENPAIAQVCINELSASNNSSSGIVDEHGDADDWIELKNGSDTPVVLSGYYVTDNPDNKTKHQLSLTDTAALTIPPYGYLILWADNETQQGATHLDFALNATVGEYFMLVKPDGETVVDSVKFPALETNTSYGRESDCHGNWQVFDHPTFFGPNKSTSVIYRENQNPITVYPNPNQGYTLFISEPIDYVLFDQSGRVLKRDFNSQAIDVSSLPNGMYFLQTQDGHSTKFIISR